MPMSSLSGSLTSPKVDVMIDMGNPFLNRTVDGFLKIGTVGASRALAEETYHFLSKGGGSNHKWENSLKKMCKEGIYWGTLAGVYVGMEYGVERIRGAKDWKNSLLGGVVSGALISAASSNNRERVIIDAITGGALATAAEFLNYLT